MPNFWVGGQNTHPPPSKISRSKTFWILTQNTPHPHRKICHFSPKNQQIWKNFLDPSWSRARPGFSRDKSWKISRRKIFRVWFASEFFLLFFWVNFFVKNWQFFQKIWPFWSNLTENRTKSTFWHFFSTFWLWPPDTPHPPKLAKNYLSTFWHLQKTPTHPPSTNRHMFQSKSYWAPPAEHAIFTQKTSW